MVTKLTITKNVGQVTAGCGACTGVLHQHIYLVQSVPLRGSSGRDSQNPMLAATGPIMGGVSPPKFLRKIRNYRCFPIMGVSTGTLFSHMTS